MANVVVNNLLRERLGESAAGAPEVLDIHASTVRDLIKHLDQRFPGVAAKLQHGVAVAIDGEIFQAPLLEPLSDTSEVYFLPAIEGG